MVTVLMGLVLALWPKETLTVLAVLVALQLLVTGVVRLVVALTSSRLEGNVRAVAGIWLFGVGLLAIVAGLRLRAARSQVGHGSPRMA